ncbi:hypothetical protein FQN60_001507 [Etheostoma spectabile]|uniref:Phospholipid/glycerol acyltransferase domain-containing protein n=1 Tax=Etheostoma spectabile TaxID=54343 RepID=A0A5J5D5H7_9PERO|nr:hypothetical protein FQN60_001507 [Etheostoma spectabile]
MLNQSAVMIFTGICGALVVMAMAYYVYCSPGSSAMALLAHLKSLFILQLLMGFVFVVSGLIINFIQLCTCILWPINKQLYRTINCRLAYSLWSQLVMLLEWWSGTECTVYTDQATVDKFGKEHVITILNHNYEIDFLCGWTMCERYGVLGSSKVLAKHELLKVPLIGWTWYFLEIVFCKRKWEEDRNTVFKGLSRLKDYPEYMWFLLYCEGTRFTETKHQISMQVAESKGLPKLKYHLLPRTKGFTTTLQCLKGTVTAVYDVTLNFKDNQTPTLLGIVNGKKYKADLSVSTKRTFLVQMRVPPGEDEQECAIWLHKLYQEKDALQEFYKKEGKFPGPTIIPPRRPWTLLNFLFWATLLLSPLINFACGVVVSGSPLLIIGFIIFLIIASIAIRRLIGVTEVKKTGSSYGNPEAKKQN